MIILFRTNASPQVGFGHLMRCRSLAFALQREGMQCVLVGPNPAYAKPSDHKLFIHWLHVPGWFSSEDDAANLISLANELQARFLVLDDYRIDNTYQLALRASGLHWLQFDGTATKPIWADLVINTNPLVTPRDYISVLHNPAAKLLLGPTYSILRPEFSDVHCRQPGRPVTNILVTFGGGDDHGAIKFVLSHLLPLCTLNQKFVVISGSANPNNSSLDKWIKVHGQGKVIFYIDPPNISYLFSICDLAVMAGGTSIYEACVYAIPMIVISIADNQVPHSQAWQQLGSLVYLGPISEVNPPILCNAFITLSTNESVRREISSSSHSAVSGKGAMLVASLISKLA